MATEKKKDANLTTWDDLTKNGMSRRDLIKLYKEHLGRPPHAVYLNGGICEKYGYYCYNIPGKVRVTKNSSSSRVRSRIAEEKALTNDSDQSATFSLTLEATHEKSASVSVTETSSISFEQKISIGSAELGIGAEYTFKFGIENSVGSTSSTSDTYSMKDNVSITLKPKSSVVVRLEFKWLEEDADFEIPITVEGYTGGHYPEPLKGQEHCFPRLSDWKTLTSYIRGSLIYAYNIQGGITVQDSSH
ncbi:hydralysin-like [Dysidea avara]|uniref:hydralysin-like n=1 Tax=Dysidea avara TaxID=196820 RepID=UPI00331FC943